MKNTELAKIIKTIPHQYIIQFLDACTIDKKWADRLTMDDRLFDILHDVNGILSKDKYFLPRL